MCTPEHASTHAAIVDRVCALNLALSAIRAVAGSAHVPPDAALHHIREIAQKAVGDDEPTIKADLLRAAAYMAAENDAGAVIGSFEAERIAGTLRLLAGQP